MKIEARALGHGVTFGAVDTDKFKNGYFSLNYILPLTERLVSECNVLTNVLLRGTKKHPSVSSLSGHIGMMYDPVVEVSASKTSRALIFRVGAYFLDSAYLPKGDKTDTLGEVAGLLAEILTEPLVTDGAFSEECTESEKKRQTDRIRSKINNKDFYALERCSTLMLGDIPAAADALGTEESVRGVTTTSLYETLQFILNECPIEAVFVGRFTREAEATVIGLITSLTEKRSEEGLIPMPRLIKPTPFKEPKSVSEDISASQGRMVMGFSVPDNGECTASIEVFNEIFGGSPISRLFMNVRERLQLCYYCASAQNYNLNVMYVRSGIDRENEELAREEILRQLKLLGDPENISDAEMHAARLGLINSYRAICDSPAQYATWYINRRLSERHTDISRCINEINAVQRSDVSNVAAGIKLNINYFLNGTEETET